MNGQQTNFELFSKLYTNLKRYIVDCAHEDINFPSIEDVIAYLSLNVKGQNLEHLERFYRAKFQTEINDLHLTEENEAKIKRYLSAMIDLL